MRSALEAISNRAQVLMTTHSPIIVNPEFVSRTVRVEKRREAGYLKPTTRKFGPIDPSMLTTLQRPLLRLFAIQRSSRFLFSRGVLLVEGVGDEYIFSAIAKRLRQFSLEDNEISVVEIGGKISVVPFAEILRELGLQVWALVDIDFLWNGAGAIFGGDELFNHFNQRLRELVPPLEVTNMNEARRRDEKQQLKQACINQLANERNDLCDRLSETGIFVLRKGEIEEYVGLGHNAKGQYVKAAEEIQTGKRDIQHQEDFERVLNAFEVWVGTPAN